ncbi:hypothetical protein ACLQ3K_25780 [Tsukamurella sp. DT100]|uniref:hypothetical protein n=1 Tax=Tsukamurella sp. DT100 TaxID=3393415 RepID=UPI003CEA1CE3
MSAVEDRLAAIAADHAPDRLSPDDGYSWVDGCTCGWMGTESPNWDAQEWADMDAPEYRTYRLWAEHLAAVIAGADDLAVVDLKKPNESDTGTEEFNLEDEIEAAREMAVPIRKIHTMRKIGNNGYYGRVDYWIAKCFVCNVDWPCDTARLVYTTEELNRDGE